MRFKLIHDTFADEIEAVVGIDELASAVISVGAKRYDSASEPLLFGSWQKVRPMLAYTYNAGYGTLECHPVYIWTADFLYYIFECNGSTNIHRMPRNPCSSTAPEYNCASVS